MLSGKAIPFFTLIEDNERRAMRIKGNMYTSFVFLNLHVL